MTANGAWREGRAWVFADANLNTDVMMPPAGRYVSRKERSLLTFSAIRPGWAGEVQEGDILIGGRNFGTGSSRPAAEVLRDLGIAGLIAESINGLFFRNCINYALPALECPGIVAAVGEGDIVAFAPESGTIVNRTTAATLTGSRIPPLLMEIVQAGGLRRRLQARGFLE